MLQNLRGWIGAHLSLQGFQLAADGVQGRKGRPQHLLHGVAGGIVGNLRNQPHLFPRGKHHLAGIVADLPGEDFEQGGFSCAVAAHDAHPFPGLDVKGQAVENIPVNVKGFDQVFYG